MRLLIRDSAANLMVLMRDAADHFTGKTGLTLTIVASKDGAPFAAITPPVTELLYGWYSLALTAVHTDTIGDLVLHITATGADPYDVKAQVVAMNLNDDEMSPAGIADAVLSEDVSHHEEDNLSLACYVSDVYQKIKMTNVMTSASMICAGGISGTGINCEASVVDENDDLINIGAAVVRLYAVKIGGSLVYPEEVEIGYYTGVTWTKVHTQTIYNGYVLRVDAYDSPLPNRSDMAIALRIVNGYGDHIDSLPATWTGWKFERCRVPALFCSSFYPLTDGRMIMSDGGSTSSFLTPPPTVAEVVTGIKADTDDKFVAINRRLHPGSISIGLVDGTQSAPLTCAYSQSIPTGWSVTVQAEDRDGVVVGLYGYAAGVWTKGEGFTAKAAESAVLRVVIENNTPGNGDFPAGTLTVLINDADMNEGVTHSVAVPKITDGFSLTGYPDIDGWLRLEDGGRAAALQTGATAGDVDALLSAEHGAGAWGDSAGANAWNELTEDHQGDGSFGKYVTTLAKEASLFSQLATGAVQTRVATTVGADISCYRGDCKTFSFSLGSGWDLTGKKAYFCAKADKAAGNGTAIINKECTIVDAASGLVSVTTTEAETALSGSYYYDVEIRDTDESDPETAMLGILTINEDVRK